jgi:hypothetical protein
LHPKREPLAMLEQIRRTIGEYNFAGQYGPLGQNLNVDARTKTDFQYVFVRSDIEQADDPGGALTIGARHDQAA